jgi:hypothetical protein
MTNLLFKPSWRRALRALGVAPALAFQASCTNLDEVPQDALTPDNAFKTDAEILAGVASVYAGLLGFSGPLWGHFNLSEVSSDEIIVPTRGSDWYDNGRWLEIYRHTWTANSGSALDDMNGIWNGLFSGVARANLMIGVVEKAGGAQKDATLAELRTLRAWYYFLLQDLFGGVPLVTGTQVGANARVSRDSVFRFISSEVTAVRGNLPERRPGAQYGRLTRGAADAILASLYLNAEVFSGTVTASGLTKGQARWQDAITAADRVINSGVYSLATDWKSNFSPTNEGSPENIFVVAHAGIPGLGFTLPMRTLHYNHLSLGPWNGFATIAETYRAFDPDDKRRQMFLVGPQVSFNTGQPITDRNNVPLDITIDIANADQARENEGPRFNKFNPDPAAPSGDAHPNDFPFFRLAEMYLIKAEAANELGQTATAIQLLNLVRQRQFSPAEPLSTGMTQAQTRAAVLNERLFELTVEGKRRQDLIRFGRYVEARRFKSASGGFRVLFPIPSTQIQANPLLTQNPGY